MTAVLVIATLAGCADSPLSPDPSDDVVVLSTVYQYGPCGTSWGPRVPPVQRTVFDLLLDDRDPGFETVAARRARVVNAGGRVLHVFQSMDSKMRVELDVSAVPSLVRREFSAAWTVTDPDNFYVTLVVGYDDVVTRDDLLAVEELGGTVDRVLRFLNFVIYSIDDRRTDAVRALAGVSFAEGDGVGCLRQASSKLRDSRSQIPVSRFTTRSRRSALRAGARGRARP